ncbi:MAG: PDZ domain-containing protein [Zavarzinella sp.]
MSRSQEKEQDKSKQIEDLEKQLAELQDRLNKLKAPPAPKKLSAEEQILPTSWVDQFHWRCVGPATMGGRVTGLAVYPADPTVYYVATATGGVLKTTNNGIKFEHLFQHENTVSIGAIAVAPSNKDIVWVGTGEANPRNSVSWGDGVYKSTDGGKTWANMGLRQSFQIGSIVVHPKNPDIVYVGALGRLYGPSDERGLYKTEDGGKTWKKVHFVNNQTGVIQVAMNPKDPENLIFATWERQRDAFDSFMGNAKSPPGTDDYAPTLSYGPGSGIYRTKDGGKTVEKLSKGLPTVKLGRVGFDWSQQTANTIFAIIDTEKAGAGKVSPSPYMGLSSETAQGGGVRITAVTEGGPAEKAGFKEGDIIKSFDDKNLRTYNAMIEALQDYAPKDKIKVAIIRGKTEMVLNLEFGTRTQVQGRPSIGIQVDEGKDGTLLTEVLANSPAERGGLKVDDLVIEVDGKPTKDRRAFFEAIQNKALGDKLKVTYIRGKDKKTVELTLDMTAAQISGRPYLDQLGGNRANVQKRQGAEGFETGGVYKSTDGGTSWTRINSINPRPFYFSTIRVDPKDDKTIYVLGVNLSRSTDGGATFTAEKLNDGVHSDQHDLWINPANSRHLLLGTDGGFYTSYDQGANWDHMNHAAALGQFYHVAVDNQTPYRIYGGLQDNGSWGGPSRSSSGPGPINDDWLFVNGGDGFVCRVDPLDHNIVYAESQNGNMMRRDMRTGRTVAIRPQAIPGSGGYRFNWNTPFIISSHNPTTFYAAGNYVFKSLKRGQDLVRISPEITLTKRGSGTALSESPRDPNTIWAGTDDGGVWLTRDGGTNWTNLSEKFKSAGLPGNYWVSTIEASRWSTGRAYVVFDGHRSNDEKPYVYVTEDFGATWKPINSNLPEGSTRVLREDIANPDLLYLGTEFAVFASINRGGAWSKINGSKGLPTVAVHEFAQPTTANELVVATHGRSIWILDVTALRQMTPSTLSGTTALMIPSPAVRWVRSFNNAPFSSSQRKYYGENEKPGAHIDYVLGSKAAKVDIIIEDATGKKVREFSGKTEAGYHRVTWDYSRFTDRTNQRPARKGPPVRPKGPTNDPMSLNPLARDASPSASLVGTYRVVLKVDDQEPIIQPLVVSADPTVPKEAATAVDEAGLLREAMKKYERGPLGRIED